MTKKINIFCDMDGILADFILGIFTIMKSRNIIKEHYTKNDWTQWNAHGNLGVSDHQWRVLFNEISLDSHFWSSLKKTEECDRIIEILNKYDPDFKILTDAPSAYAIFGKQKWLKKHKITNAMIAEKYKYKHIEPKGMSLLIDDKPLNCDKFVEYGGYALLFSRPWNKVYTGGSAVVTIDSLEKRIAELVQ